jgi:multisubunit Na+/H+ antiporter MnhF subunit
LVTTDLPSGVRTGTLLRCALDKQLVVLAVIIRVFAQENAEDRVFTENISVINSLLTAVLSARYVISAYLSYFISYENGLSHRPLPGRPIV